MRRALALIAALAVAGSTRADVTRYDVENAEFTIFIDDGRIHTFTVEFNPCNNTYAGVGTSTQGPFAFSQGPYDFFETVEGTFDPATTAFTFIATVTGVEPQNPADPSFLSATGIDLVGYEWRSDAPFTRRFPEDPFPADGTWHSNRFEGEAGSTATLTYWQATGTKGYRNHGQYVKANKGVDDAAHSCIGMPKQSVN